MTQARSYIQPSKLPPNAAHFIMTPEDALEFGKELGAGAFSIVYEIVHTHTYTHTHYI